MPPIAHVDLGPATCPLYLYVLASGIAEFHGAPPWLVLGLGFAESGLRPDAKNVTPNEASYGILQLNQKGGQGYGIPTTLLLNPGINLLVGVPPIARAYHLALDEGLQGLPLVEAVAASSGHNRSDGRITPDVQTIARRAISILFAADGSWAKWPPVPWGLSP